MPYTEEELIEWSEEITIMWINDTTFWDED